MAKSIFKVLESEWKNLIDIVKSGQEPPTIFQRNLFYKCRTLTIRSYGKEQVCDFSYFKYDLIYKLEKKYGYSREELGIRAKPDASLYTRNEIKLIKYQHNYFPVVSIIATEKSGIAESLAEYLTKYGIYVIDTTGNQGRYPIQLVEARKDIPIFCIEDLDITGCFMGERFKEVGAKKIDLLYIADKLNIPQADLWEEDAGGHKNHHLDSIDPKDKELLKVNGKYRRIEIDTIMDYTSPEAFADVILDFLDKEIPIKDMSKVMELGEWIYVSPMPKIEADNIKSKIDELEEKYKDSAEKVLDMYRNLEKPFRELELENIEAEAKEVLDNDQ